MRIRSRGSRVPALLALLLPALVGCNEPPSEPRNLLLITVDTLRADHLGSYGYTRDTSPTLDRLAAEGVRFANPIAQRGGTWPSLTSILTSMYPHSHGVRYNGQPLEASKPTVAELLQQKGFKTGAILTNMITAPNRGFDDRVLIESGRGERARDAEAEAAALAWLEQHRDEKFFLWLHWMGPHDPYQPSPEFERSFDTGYTGPLDGSHAQLMHLHESRRRLPQNELDHIVSLYDAEIREVDARIERVLQQLDELGLRRNTLVAFASDHGEELAQHNFYFLHSWSIYDSVLRVPMILGLPGFLPSGKRIDAVVESIDLAPTLFELLGVAIPESFEGRSLAGRIFGDADTRDDAPAAFSELGPWIHSLRTDRWHYLHNPQGLSSPGARESDSGDAWRFRIAREELYDVQADPQEQHNVVREHPVVAAELRNRLLGWAARATKPHHPQRLSPETRDELKALGYIE